MLLQFMSSLSDHEDLEVYVTAHVYPLSPIEEGTGGYDVVINSVRTDEGPIDHEDLSHEESDELRQDALSYYQSKI